MADVAAADAFVALPRLRGRVDYRKRGGERWGEEEWVITRGRDGLRILSAHCEMTLDGQNVVRDSILSIQPDHHPRDAFVRIMRDGILTGSGWFLFDDDCVTCESWTRDEGRVRQQMAISRPTRGFGIHAVQGDAWLAATFPYEKGPGYRHFFGRNLMHSTHHLGATGPMIATTGSGLEYVGRESVKTPAGEFDCFRLAFVGFTNAHPPYTMWVSADGEFLYVRGEVEGYMDSVFELAELNREHGA